jgi:hypothetical protein
MPVSPSDAEVVRAFRRQAADVRRALSAPGPASAPLEVVGGYIQAEGWLQQTRRLSVPIRRIHLPHDKASFLRSCQILERHDDPAVAAGARAAGEAYRALLAELEIQTTLGGRKVARGEMLRAWLDASVFYDSHDKSQPYEEMIEEMGKAVEGIALHLTEQMAAAVLQLDEAAASALGEPVVLPPPARTPPPPPEPRGWRHLLQSLFGHRPEAARKSSL